MSKKMTRLEAALSRPRVARPLRMFPEDADAIGRHVAEIMKEKGVLGGSLYFRIENDDDLPVYVQSLGWDSSDLVRDQAIEAKCEADGGTDCNDYSATTAEVLPDTIADMREMGAHELADWYNQYLPS